MRVSLLKRLSHNSPKAVRSLYYALYWRGQLWVRSIREYLSRFKLYSLPKHKAKPFVLYMTGMPRTGSSFMKNYLGDYDGFKVMPFERRGFFINWERSFNEIDVLVDKSTHYIRHIEKILATCNDNIAICCIVRDPRDQLVSLFEFDRHPELERDERFWVKWVNQYRKFIDFSENNENFYLVKYEDLVSNPVEEKTKFLEWMKVPITKPVTSRYELAHKNDIQDDKVKFKTAPSTDSLNRHKLVNNKRELEIINYYKRYEAAKELMELLGYLNDE